MSHREASLKEDLIENDDEYRRLFQEHQNFESRLNEIYSKSALSQEDEMEQKRIKLHKLSLKDQMEQIVRSRRSSRVPA